MTRFIFSIFITSLLLENMFFLIVRYESQTGRFVGFTNKVTEAIVSIYALFKANRLLKVNTKVVLHCRRHDLLVYCCMDSSLWLCCFNLGIHGRAWTEAPEQAAEMDLLNDAAMLWSCWNLNLWVLFLFYVSSEWHVFIMSKGVEEERNELDGRAWVKGIMDKWQCSTRSTGHMQKIFTVSSKLLASKEREREAF